MRRPTLAVIIAFIAWSAGWLAYNVLLRSLGLLPANPSLPVSETSSLLALLAGSVVLSLLAGAIAAQLKNTSSQAAIAVLGGLLLAVGILVQSQYLRLMPIWYHAAFLILLIPMCYLGASLRRPALPAA
jgi:hypothetical protein